MYLNNLEKSILSCVLENLEGIEIEHCSCLLEAINKLFSYEIKQEAILNDYDSKVWISQNFIDLSDYTVDVEDYINLASPFWESSKFMLQMVLFIAEYLLKIVYYPYMTSEDLILAIKERIWDDVNI